MLKRIAVVVAMAFVVLAATADVQAQHRYRPRTRRPVIEVNIGHHGNYGSYYGYGYYGDPFTEQLDAVRAVPFAIWDSHERAMAQIMWEHDMETRAREMRRRSERFARYGSGLPIPYPGTPMGPYQMGYRYPWDSCDYSWNRQGSCTRYADPDEWEGYWKENPREGERYARKDGRPEPGSPNPQGDDVPRVSNQPVAMVTIMNLTGCPAKINGQNIPDEGLLVPEADRLFAEVNGPCANKHFKRLGENLLGLKCRP